MVARGVVTTAVLIGFDVKFILPFVAADLLLLVFVLLLLLNDDVVESFWHPSNASEVFSFPFSREKDDRDSAKKSIFKSGIGEVTFELG